MLGAVGTNVIYNPSAVDGRRSAVRERRVGLPPRGALASMLLAMALLLEACSSTAGGARVPGGPSGAGGNRRGDTVGERADATTPRDASGRSGQEQGDDRASASGPGAVDGTLTSSDLGLVYQLILDRYVDQVDHAALVQAANGAVRETAMRDSALPIDTAPLDFAPPPAGSPQRDWQNFARAYEAVSQKHPGARGSHAARLGRSAPDVGQPGRQSLRVH